VRRREFITLLGGAAAAWPLAPPRAESSVLVNDIHSQLNPTRVDRIIAIDSEATLRAALAAAEGKPVCVAGGRHAMGGQQFAGDAALLDMRPMRRVIHLDTKNGVVEAEAGIQWPELIERLTAMQWGQPEAWGIIQKQTGADRLTLGGALGANIHGRGLALKPIIGDVESFTLMHADGSLSTCSRSENRELFNLAIGGYGLFGVITRVRLRLRRRTKLERIVRIIDIDYLMPTFVERISEGYLYGDWQFSTDATSNTYMRKGVFACYRPLPADAPMPREQKELGETQWRELYYQSHADTRRAYEAYTSYYLSTSGQRYWSDLGQLSVYIDDYHADLDRRLGSPHKGSEMISELYVPRPALSTFLAAVRTDFRRHGVELIYGTIRLIERDEESILAWAREPWVCTVMNLHVDHRPDGIAKAADDFRRLIDRAIEFGGSYFLTYHRWASRTQVNACHPRMVEFLRAKRRHDPAEAFQSDWYRHHKEMFADQL
jgi:FAD binding domain